MGQAENAPLIGRALGDFILREKLASGGQGDVYLAEQPALHRRAVLKLLTGHAPSDLATKRFLREARLASQLDHPYAAHIYAFGAETDGILWIAMELVRGTTLGQWLEGRGPITLVRFVPFLECVCEVLSEAHAAGIVHRDLKPDNLMVLSRAGRLLPKLLDFGIAKGLTEPFAAAAADPERATGSALATNETLAEVERTLARTHGTQRGTVVGSPRYMAPEQWINPAGTDRRTDIYALGALTFEALTGKHAFSGKTVMELARAHAKSPPPTLMADFPAGLSAVIAKALAKRVEERYETVLEFAAAFRAASETKPLDVVLPSLDEDLADAVVTTAPQPIAECLSAYEGARTLEAGHRALIEVAHACLEYLLVVAVCARHHSGGLPSDADDERASALARDWCDVGLTSKAKVELIAAMCEPFADTPDLFAVPELALLAKQSDGALHRLADITESPLSGDARADCIAAKEQLEKALSALSFLSDYPLAARRGGHVVRLMGLRRRRASMLATREPQTIADGEPMLFDGTGTAIVSLFPLAQVGAPTPGEPDELFLLQSGHRLGTILRSRPVGYERRDDQCRTFLSQLTGNQAGHDNADDKRAPYRGLSTFSQGDADWFFGREKEAEAFANRLRTQHFIAVVGPSGVGKSSFIRAGVLPRLGDVRTIICRPGSEPIAALRASIASATGESSETVAKLESADDFGKFLVPETPGGFVVVVVDQFEELVTLCRSAEDRDAFGEILVSLGSDRAANVRVIVTLRDDFLMRLEQVPSLRNTLGRGIQLLSTPIASDLERTLTAPAEKVGYTFDPPTLPTMMVADVEARPGALALLSFTALKLWQLRDEGYKKLHKRAYETMGGVGGALAQHAEETIAALSDDQQRLVREAFRRLVTADGTRAVLSRAELIEVLGNSSDASVVLEALISARLLATSEGADGEDDRVEVVHEALLSAWPRLVEWRQSDAESARLRDQLREAARQWQARDKPRGLLWRDEALTEYTLWRPRYAGQLTARESEFAEASIAEANRGRRIRRTIAGLVAVVLLGSSLVLLFMYRDSQRQRRVAVSAEKTAAASERAASERFLELLVEQGRLAALDERPLVSLAYIEAAIAAGGRGNSIDYLATVASRVSDDQLASFSGHIARVTSLAVAADGNTLWSASWSDTDTDIAVWDLEKRRAAARLVGHERGILSLSLSPDGAYLLSTDRGARAIVWRASDGANVIELDGIKSASWAPDRPVIATAGEGGIKTISPESKVVTVISSQSARALAWHGDGLIFIGGDDAISAITARGRSQWTLPASAQPSHPDTLLTSGSQIVAFDADLGSSTPFLVDAKTGQVQELRGYGDGFSAIAVHEQRKLIAAAAGSRLGLWTLEGKPVRILETNGAETAALAFDSSGERLAVTTQQRTIRLYSTETGVLSKTLHGHIDTARALAFIPQMPDRLISGANDLTIKLWRLDTVDRQEIASGVDGMFTDPAGTIYTLRGRELKKLGSSSSQASATLAETVTPFGFFDMLRGEVSSNGRLALTSKSGAIAISVATGELIARCPSPMPLATSAAMSPNGQFLAATSRNGVTVLCDVDRNITIELGGPPIKAGLGITFSPDSQTLIIAGPQITRWRTDGTRLPALDAPKTTFWMVAPRGQSPAGANDLLTSSIDGSVRFWKGGRETHRYRSDGFIVQALETDVLVLGLDAAGEVLVWDRGTTKLLGVLRLRSVVDGFTLDPSGALIVATRDGRLVRFDMDIDSSKAAELAQLIKCELPYHLVDGELRTRSAKRIAAIPSRADSVSQSWDDARAGFASPPTFRRTASKRARHGTMTQISFNLPQIAYHRRAR